MIQALNGIGADWGEYLLLAMAQNTLFLGLVLVILRQLKNSPARVKYFVALAGLVKILLPPFLNLPKIVTPALTSVSGYGGLIPFITTSAGRTESPAAEAMEWLTPAGFIMGLWASVVLMALSVTAVASLRLALRLRGAKQVPGAQLPEVPGIGDIRVLVSGRTAVPMTVAFFPRRIFVPLAWENWSPSCKRMVLLHEMAHLRRRDGLVVVMQMIARAIYFFHPFVALLDRRISEYREMACDDATVGPDRDSGVEYSRYLVEIAESLVRCPSVCGSASALIRRKNELLSRVRYQLEEGRMRSISKTRTILLAAAIALLAVSLSWYRGGASTGSDYPAPPKPPKPPAQESDSGKKPVNVLLRSDGMDIDGESVDVQELSKVLLGVAGDDPGSVLINLVCADDVPMGNVRFFHEMLEKGGIDKIRYVNDGGEGHPIQLPPRKALERLEEMPADMILDVTVAASGGIVVGTRKVEPEKVTAAVKERLGENPLAVVVIHNEEETTYDDFVKVLGLVRDAGAERIAIKFDEEE